MSSLLNDLRSHQITASAKATEDYLSAIQECPPVSNAMIEHLKKMYTRKIIKPTSSTMSQELIYQAGIDKIITYLENANTRQEKEQQDIRTKGVMNVQPT